MLEQALKQIAEEIANNEMMDFADGKAERKFSMDPDEYAFIKDMAEKGEFIDFEIPKDASLGKKLSESLIGLENEKEIDPDDLEPVNLNELFNK